MWTVDVKKAFLKGISYSELAAATGEPLRVVNFELDRESVEVLRRFTGVEDFDPMTEVLSNIRPGTGNVDAPRCFGRKLDQVFQKFGAPSGVHDRHVLVRRQSQNRINRLRQESDFICTDHVDDIKVGRSEGAFSEFKACFEEVFGKGELEITHCGSRRAAARLAPRSKA